LSKSSSKYGLGIRDPRSEIRDPGSEIRDPEKTHSGSRIQGSKRHRIRIRNTAQNIRILWIWKPELKEFILFFIYDGMIRMRIREAQKTYGF
jgi:hypothetical protein